MWRSHAGSHEEHHVLVPGLPVVHHFLFEELQVVLIVAVDLEQTDGDLAVPPTLVHPTPAALEPAETLSAGPTSRGELTRPVRSSHFPDELAEVQLLKGDVPLLQVHAGLAGLAGDGALPLVAPRAG